jgi:hypothetical protein
MIYLDIPAKYIIAFAKILNSHIIIHDRSIVRKIILKETCETAMKMQLLKNDLSLGFFYMISIII